MFYIILVLLLLFVIEKLLSFKYNVKLYSQTSQELHNGEIDVNKVNFKCRDLIAEDIKQKSDIV